MRENIIVMVGGRSGVGKTSIIDFLVKNQGERYARPLSYTSRLKRNGEGCEEYNFMYNSRILRFTALLNDWIRYSSWTNPAITFIKFVYRSRLESNS